MEDNSKILAKLKKILELQEGAKAVGNLAEAEAAARRAQTLLLKHNLELADVEGYNADKLVIHRIEFDFSDEYVKTESDWVPKLVGVIARHNLCRVILSYSYEDQIKKRQPTLYNILGTELNVMAAEYISRQLITKVRYAARKAWSTYTGIEKRNTFIRGFLRGAVIGIHAQLEEQRKQDIAVQSNALVVVDQHKSAVDRAVQEIFGNLKSRKANSLSGASGVGEGVKFGKSVNVNRGITGGGLTQKRLG